MKRTQNYRHVLRVAAAVFFFTCASSSLVQAASLTISPSSGTELTGQVFSVSVNVSGLDPANDLYDYSFDLKFDPLIFKALTANDGTIFNYGGNTPVYFDGAIDNSFGIVSNQSGLDTNASFNGSGGLLGVFTFEALRPTAGATIAVQNVSLSTFSAASNLEPPDIDPGTLPVATLDTVGTAIPEPDTGALAAFILACGALVRQKRRS